jgi:hypothetical protein
MFNVGSVVSEVSLYPVSQTQEVVLISKLYPLLYFDCRLAVDT